MMSESIIYLSIDGPIHSLVVRLSVSDWLHNLVLVWLVLSMYSMSQLSASISVIMIALFALSLNCVIWVIPSLWLSMMRILFMLLIILSISVLRRACMGAMSLFPAISINF